MTGPPEWKYYLTTDGSTVVYARILPSGTVQLEEGSCRPTMAEEDFLATHVLFPEPEPKALGYGPNPPTHPTTRRTRTDAE